METSTPFDLNQAIQQWRDGLAQSPAIRGENLAELEVHLRDSVSALEARGLAADEAFLVATKRTGSGAVLGKEFAKANPQSVWLERGFWGLILMQTWNALCSLISNMVSAVSQVSGFRFTTKEPDLNGWLGFVLFVTIPAMGVFLAAMLAWRLLESPQGWLRKTLENLSSRPYLLAISLLALSVAAHTLSVMIIKLAYGGRAIVFWNYFSSLPVDLLFAVAVLILARKRLLKKA